MHRLEGHTKLSILRQAISYLRAWKMMLAAVPFIYIYKRKGVGVGGMGKKIQWCRPFKSRLV